MNPPRFLNNERPTLGIEVELQLVDARTMALRGSIAEVLDALPAELHASVKPELLQCCLEVTTEVCRDVAEAERDLAQNPAGGGGRAPRGGVPLLGRDAPVLTLA